MGEAWRNRARSESLVDAGSRRWASVTFFEKRSDPNFGIAWPWPATQSPTYHSPMKLDRLEAVGPRGEACIIIRTEADADGGAKRYRYALGTGDRLRPASEGGVFETFDGARQYRLRSGTVAPASGDI